MLQGDHKNLDKTGIPPGVPCAFVSLPNSRVTAIYYLAINFAWHKREQREE
jgi:hypothetical protein